MGPDEEDDMFEDPGWKGENQMSPEDWGNQIDQNEEWRREEIEEMKYDEVKSEHTTYEEREGVETFTKVDEKYIRNPRNFHIEVKPGEIIPIGIGFGQNLKRMPREGWEALRPMPRSNLQTPVSKVRFTYTGTPTCTTTEECMDSCRKIQKYYMDLGFPDIPYNFLIGGDGVVYHGRGWQKQADRPYKYNNLKKYCVDVAYIGNYEYEKVPFSMLSTGADFLKYGLKIGKITPFFQAYSFVGEKHV